MAFDSLGPPTGTRGRLVDTRLGQLHGLDEEVFQSLALLGQVAQGEPGEVTAVRRRGPGVEAQPTAVLRCNQMSVVGPQSVAKGPTVTVVASRGGRSSLGMVSVGEMTCAGRFCGTDAARASISQPKLPRTDTYSASL